MTALDLHPGRRVPIVLGLAALGGLACGVATGYLVGRAVPIPFVTGACVSTAVAAFVVGAHARLGAPALGRRGARGVLWGTLALALLGQVLRDAVEYRQFRDAARARLVAGPGAPRDPDLYLNVVLLAETGQPGFRGYVLATLGVDRAQTTPGTIRLRVLSYMLAMGLTAALAAQAAQAAVRSARCPACRRRAERCACGRTPGRSAP